MAESVLKILRKDESKGDRPGAGQPSDEQPLAADPKPKAGGGGRRQKATAAQVRAISEELTVGLKFFAGAWSMRGQHCAPVLNEHAKAISAELASILAESPRVLAWFEGVSGIGSWGKLLVVGEAGGSAVLGAPPVPH